MSDTPCLSPHDAAIATLRERRADLEIDERVIRGRIAELDEMIVLLSSRRPRVKKPRSAEASDKVSCASTTDAEDLAPRPTVFAMPSGGDTGDAAEAA